MVSSQDLWMWTTSSVVSERLLLVALTGGSGSEADESQRGEAQIIFLENRWCGLGLNFESRSQLARA